MVNFGFGNDVNISRHAKRQWRDRVTDPPPGDEELEGSTWLNAEPVHAPKANCEEARLYRMRGARDMLLCGHRKSSGMVVATVLYADYSRLPGESQGF